MPNFRLEREGSANNWYVVWGEGRRTKRRSMGTPVKELAVERQKVFVARLLQPKNAIPDDILIESVLRQYQDDQGGDAASAWTAKTIFNHLVSYYAGKSVSYLNKSTNKQYEKDRKKAAWANGTINRNRSTLRAALNHAVENGDLTAAPYIPTLQEPPAMERHLSRPEAARLLRAVRPARWYYMRLFVLIGLYTGARHEAILQLTWDRVDFVLNRIDFRMPGRAETNKRRIDAPAHRHLMMFLRYARRRSNGMFVIEHRGGPIRRVDDAFNNACARAKLKGVTAHTLKHTCITWLLQDGVSVWDVSGLTATSVDTITKVYGKHIPNALAAAVNRTHKAPISKTLTVSAT